MEVLVALAVLGASSAVFLRYVDGFSRQRNIERDQAKAFICSAKAMEYLVQHAPACNTAHVQGPSPDCPATSYSLSKIPGIAPILVASVYTEAVHSVRFRRLVQCK